MEKLYIVHSGELYHHGTKGMKWGRRLYQHKDGSLTRLGRLRYGKKGPPDSEKKEQVDKETQKQRVLSSRSASELYKNAHLFNDQELHSAYQRLILEQNIANLGSKEVSKGEQRVNKMVKFMDKTTTVVTSGSKLYNGVARVFNAFGAKGKDNKLPIIDLGDGKKKDKDNNNNDNNKKKSAFESVVDGLNNKAKKQEEQTNKDRNNKKQSDEGSKKSDTDSKKNNTKSDKKTDTTENQSYSGTVEGEGTSKSKFAEKHNKKWYEEKSDYVNVDYWDDVPVSNVQNSESYSRGIDAVAGYLTTRLDDILDD
jgi:hypothetical protein